MLGRGDVELEVARAARAVVPRRARLLGRLLALGRRLRRRRPRGGSRAARSSPSAWRAAAPRFHLSRLALPVTLDQSLPVCAEPHGEAPTRLHLLGDAVAAIASSGARPFELAHRPVRDQRASITMSSCGRASVPRSSSVSATAGGSTTVAALAPPLLTRSASLAATSTRPPRRRRRRPRRVVVLGRAARGVIELGQVAPQRGVGARDARRLAVGLGPAPRRHCSLP